jgi:hypothetical protein
MIKVYLILILIFIIICFCKNKTKTKESFEDFKYQPEELIYSCMNFDDGRDVHDCKEFSYKDIEEYFICEEIYGEGCNLHCKNKGEQNVDCIPKDYANEETTWGKFKKYCEENHINAKKIKDIEAVYAPLKQQYEDAIKEFNKKTEEYENQMFDYKLANYTYLEEQNNLNNTLLNNQNIKDYLTKYDEFIKLNPENDSELITTLAQEVNDLANDSTKVQEKERKETKLNLLKKYKEEMTALKSSDSGIDDYLNKRNSLVEPTLPVKPADNRVNETKKEFYRCSYASKCPSKGLLTLDQNLAYKNLGKLMFIVNHNDEIKKTLTDQFKCSFDTKNSCESKSGCLWSNKNVCMPKNMLCIYHNQQSNCNDEEYCSWRSTGLNDPFDCKLDQHL